MAEWFEVDFTRGLIENEPEEGEQILVFSEEYKQLYVDTWFDGSLNENHNLKRFKWTYVDIQEVK